MSIRSRETSYEYDDTADNQRSDLTKLLIGGLAGAFVGSLVAGAFTEKGIEIRNQISESGRNLGSDLKDKVSDVKGVIADKFESVKESAADLLEKGKQKVGISSAKATYNTSDNYYRTTDSENSPSGTSIIIGALIVSVASTIVWSFATEKGNATRRRIARGTADIADNVKTKVADVATGVAETVTDTYQTAKEGATDLIEQLKDQAPGQPLNTRFTGPGSGNKA